ncbi:MAG TPA: branched-chain amino acid aminotransferase [Pseudobdellovibrionaceae bacterium]|nr:branched-chain amino acid aminotransferase [Pseudobdellovibrionaceae bacterium]
MKNLKFINTIKSQSPKLKPTGELGFGKYFTDHIFICDYNRKKGWFDPHVIPYGDFRIDPSASVLHYGQAMFEGMKAFRHLNGDIALFRPEYNYERMKSGADRLCMEMPSIEIFIEGVKELVRADLDWIPSQRGSSLYLRPTLMGTEAFLGVRPSDEYRFFVIASPVSSYYKEGIGPVKIWVEENYVRAAPGGLGSTKAAANYAGSLKAAHEAKQKGYSQVLWLDVNHEYVEEVGTMNVFFMIDGEAHTPLLDGTILAGSVRDSVIQLLKNSGISVVERKIKWAEIDAAFQDGRLTEAFGTGTAAVISPIGELTRGLKKLNLAETQEPFKVGRQVYDQMTAIQYGEAPDIYNWLMKVNL